METEIEIHVLKDGTQMITAMVAGRPIAMTSFEWQLFCRDMLGAIETHLTKRPLDFAICAPEYHASLDEAGDRFCRMCGQPLSQ